MSSVVSAISGSCGLVAVYSPTTSISSSDSLQRLVVKCYDSKVSLGTLKFTLVANLTSSSSSSSSSSVSNKLKIQSQSQSQSLVVSQLFFCGDEDDYLIATVSTDGDTSTFHVIVWDLKRGVVCHKIQIPNNSILCTANGGQKHQHLYLLLKNIHSSKLTVNVHDLSTDSAKLIKQVKIGPSHSHSHGNHITFGMALHEAKQLIVVQYGKRMKISPLTKGQAHQAIKCKIKQPATAATTTTTTTTTTLTNTTQEHHDDTYTHSHNHITFSDDAAFVILTHSNGILFYSTTDGEVKGSAPLSSLSDSLPDFTRCCLQVHKDAAPATPVQSHDNSPMLIVLTGQPAGTASLFHVHPRTIDNNMTHFATLTPPKSTNFDNDANTNIDGRGSNKFLHTVYVPPGKRGKSNLLLLQLTPRGNLGDVNVHISELQYRSTTDDNDDHHGRLLEGTDITKSPLLKGELYPTEESENTHNNNDNKASAISKKKRKMGNIVLGPGEGGGEAMNVTDSATLFKKRKTTNNALTPSKQSNDDDDDSKDEFAFLNLTNEQDGNKEAGDGTTIAERLALLSSQLDRDDNNDNHDEPITPNDSATKSTPTKLITSDSLITLLRQALVSNDDTQLEVALQVSDKKMIANSVEALCAECMEDDYSGTNLVMTLLSKLTTRLSRKAGRAESLGFWVSATLLALISPSAPPESDSLSGGGGSMLLEMGTTQMEVAQHLGPLRNMLSERVESLPSLLRLEGRLGLLGKLT